MIPGPASDLHASHSQMCLVTAPVDLSVSVSVLEGGGRREEEGGGGREGGERRREEEGGERRREEEGGERRREERERDKGGRGRLACRVHVLSSFHAMHSHTSSAHPIGPDLCECIQHLTQQWWTILQYDILV